MLSIRKVSIKCKLTSVILFADVLGLSITCLGAGSVRKDQLPCLDDERALG
jgi:hypothetical protein